MSCICTPKCSDTWNIAVIILKLENADKTVNSVDPDQTAGAGAVWSGSALFFQTYLSENLGSLRYVIKYLSRDMTKPSKCAPSEDSDQPGHPPRLIRVFAVHSMGS